MYLGSLRLSIFTHLPPGFEDYRECIAHSRTQYNGSRVHCTVKLVPFDPVSHAVTFDVIGGYRYWARYLLTCIWSFEFAVGHSSLLTAWYTLLQAPIPDTPHCEVPPVHTPLSYKAERLSLQLCYLVTIVIKSRALQPEHVHRSRSPGSEPRNAANVIVGGVVKIPSFVISVCYHGECWWWFFYAILVESWLRRCPGWSL